MLLRKYQVNDFMSIFIIYFPHLMNITKARLLKTFKTIVFKLAVLQTFVINILTLSYCSFFH